MVEPEFHAMISMMRRFFWILCFVAVRHSLCLAETQFAPSSNIFQRYEAAFNAHDADAVASFWALENQTPEQRAKTLARWKDERAFEAANHAVFQISAKPLGGDAFEVTQREDCDFYRELGTGIKTSTFVVHVRDGNFHDAHRGTSTDALGNYEETKAAFKDWILKNRPDRAASVIRDGDFDFNGKTADPILDLLREWRQKNNKETSARGRPSETASPGGGAELEGEPSSSKRESRPEEARPGETSKATPSKPHRKLERREANTPPPDDGSGEQQ